MNQLNCLRVSFVNNSQRNSFSAVNRLRSPPASRDYVALLAYQFIIIYVLYYYVVAVSSIIFTYDFHITFYALFQLLEFLSIIQTAFNGNVNYQPHIGNVIESRTNKCVTTSRKIVNGKIISRTIAINFLHTYVFIYKCRGKKICSMASWLRKVSLTSKIFKSKIR